MSSTMSLNFSPPSPNLQYLPAELVDEIAQYLSPLSKLSLRYTCHRFRHYFSITIKSLRKENFTKSSSNIEERNQWYNFLCMLERDQRISQLVCSECKQTHHITLFSQLAQRTYPRRCLASEGEPWICPHGSYTRAELRLLRLYAQSHTRWQPLLVDIVGFIKDYCLWRAIVHRGKPLFPAHYDCSCRKIKRSQHLLFLHIEASKFTSLQARLEKALGMSASVKCFHVRNPTREPVRRVEHENCPGPHSGELPFRCRLCMEYGVVNGMSK